MTSPMTPTFFTIVAIIVFSCGIVGLLVRRNLLVIVMCVELMFNAANLLFVSFAWAHGSIEGHTVALLVIAVATIETVIALAVITVIWRDCGDNVDNARLASATDLDALTFWPPHFGASTLAESSARRAARLSNQLDEKEDLAALEFFGFSHLQGVTTWPDERPSDTSYLEEGRARRESAEVGDTPQAGAPQRGFSEPHAQGGQPQ